MPILKEVLSEKKVTNTSEYAMSWMKFMLQSYNKKLIPEIKDILSRIMEKIYESCGKNMYDIIESMKMKDEYCDILVETMLSFLLERGIDNEYKVESMMKKFIGSHHAFKFLTILCRKIIGYQHRQRFVYDIANTLNAIIVGEEVMLDIRKKLNNWQEPDYK